KGAPDSDVNGTGLTVGATVVDGVVFAKDTTDFNVIIDSVADGDDKGDDGDADKLGVTIEVTDGGDANSTFQVGETGNVKVTASYDDFVDGSETHTLTIQLAPGFTWTVGSVVPGGFTVLLAGTDSDTVVLQVDSSNGVGDIEVNLSVKYNGGVAGNESGVFSATVVATETPTDSECNPDNNTDSATATDTVGLASPPDSNVSIGAEGNTEAICVPEDSLGVDIPVTATTSAGSHLTQIVITGFPAGGGGFTINELGLNSANTSAVYDAVAGTLTITFLNDTTANFSGTFKVIPPADSDLDLGTLTATLTAVDNVDPALTDTDADQAFVRVDAIADGKGPGFGDDGDGAVLSVSLTASDSPADLDGVFAAGEKGQLTLGATFDDFNDGSELHQITITAPAGFQFTGTITGLPAGVTVNTSNASTIVLDVDSNGVDGVGTIANVQIEIQNVGAPDSVTLDFTAIASAVEQNTTATNGDGNDECTDGNNAQSVSTTAAVTSQTDKLPVAYDDKVCGDEAAPRNVNVLLILDRSGSMGDEIPGSGGKTRLELLQEATAAMLNALAENGDVRVMVVGFTTSASSNNQWVDVATAITLINALTPGNLTNYEDALDVGANAFNQDVADRGDFADHDNLVFFMSDGVPTTGGDSDNGNELTNDNKEAWDNFLENPGNSIDQLTVVGIGSDIAASDDDLEDVADPDYTPGDVDAKNPFGQVLIVADENDLKDALGGAIATAKIEGNVLDGSIENDDTSPNGAVDGDGSAPTPGDADNLGDTPTHISQFKYDAAVDNLLDITINYDGTGDVDLLDITGGKGVSIDGTKVSFDADYGRMTFDFSTGKFTFLADSIDGGDKEEHFNYTLKDTDGDVDSANLIVCIQDKYVDLQPIAYDNHDALTESSVSGAVTIVNDFNAGGTGGTLYGGSGQAGGEMVLTTSDGSGAEEYSSLRTSLIAEGLSGAALDALVGDLPDEGSAFVRPVSVAGPSVLRFEYDYNGNSDDNDVALYFVLNSSNQIVAQGVLGEGNPDVANGVVTVPLASAGNYKVIFTVNDRDDDSGSSTLDIDRIETQPATIHTVSGNVVLDPNDTPSGSSDPAGAVDVLGDGTNRVTLVQFGSTIVDVPSDGSNVIVTGANGILTINSTGAYTYTSLPGTVANGAVETDAFTYTLKDSDGDSDTAILRIDSNGVGGTVTISDVTVNEGGTANIVVTLSEPAPVGGLTLNYTFSGGTATSGDDYTAAAVGATVTVLAGATTANIVVNAKTDGVFDDNETYNVVLSGAPAGWTISDATGVVTIDDKTTVTAPVVTFTAQDPGTSGWPTSGGFTTNGSNTFNGDDNNNRLDGESGNDVIDGKGGHDQVQGGSGDDSLTGGSGNDFLEGEDNNDTLNGGTGNDLLSGDAGNDQANGGDDADDVNGDAGNDILHGNAGNDLVNGGDDSDQVFGDDGNDELFGGNGTDTLNGGNNSDYLHGDDDSSLDKLLGGDGDDWISVESNDLGAGRQIDGGAGNDVLDISGSDLTGSTGITGIEVINMEGGGNQDDVSLNASDVVAIAGGGTLFIWGDGSGGADDDVALTGGGWTQVGDNQSSNGRTYDVFQNGTTLVAVDTDVEVALS
ncbi:MAG TPA: VWA domain-containing protein, partial [Dongiaceae bacterium]|nr:VWA domain-containing protein [Dongiaceae bacterium]